MIPRGSPYISWSDLLAAAVHCVLPSNPHSSQSRLEAYWAPNSVACLSVRSGIDALFQVLAFPAGSEIIVSAITIPHILDILGHHRLIAVPVDIDVRTLAVDAESVRQAITNRTKAVLVAHLFGSRMPLDEIGRIAREHDLLLIEDCAQANDGSGYRGHADSSVSMFSFGSIKRQTALGGGLLRFQNPRLAEQVRRKQATYPRQSRAAYLQRVLTMTAIKSLALRPIFQLFIVGCRWSGQDHDQVLGSALRAFGRGDLFTRLRQQPSTPLLRVLERRLGQSPTQSIAKRVAIVETATAAFPAMRRPGTAAANHTHWLFPMLTPRRERLLRHLWAKGFDATCGASNLIAVPAPDGRPAPVEATQLMAEILYLPLFPSATSIEIQRMAHVVQDLDAPSISPRSLTAVR